MSSDVSYGFTIAGCGKSKSSGHSLGGSETHFNTPNFSNARELIAHVELRPGERQTRFGPGIVADNALVAARVVPRLDSLSAGSLSVLNSHLPVFAFGADERGIGLFVVPAVGVAMPIVAIEMEDLRLQSPPRFGLAAIHFHPDCFRQHAVFGK